MFMVKQGTQHYVRNLPSQVTLLSKSVATQGGDQQKINEKIETTSTEATKKRLQLIIVNFSARCNNQA